MRIYAIVFAAALVALLLGSANAQIATDQGSTARTLCGNGSAWVPCTAGGGSGGAGLPSGTGSAASGSTTIATANTYQTLFAGGSIVHGAYIQNPSTNTVPLYVDWAGTTGTTLSTTAQQIPPGASVNASFLPTNAVTVFATSAISFIAGKY
jgi:hypothetical protein